MKIINILVFCLFVFSFVIAETKLTDTQKQVLKQQEDILREVEKKIKGEITSEEVKGLLQKLRLAAIDLEKNRFPEGNTQVAELKSQLESARDKIVKVSDKLAKANKANKEKTIEDDNKKKAEVESLKPPTENKSSPEKNKTPLEEDAETRTNKNKQVVAQLFEALVSLEEAVVDLKEQEPKLRYFPYPFVPGLGFQKNIDQIINFLNKENCPASESQMTEVLERVEKVKTTLVELEVKLKPKAEAYDKVANIANYPSYSNDTTTIDRLRHIYTSCHSLYTRSKEANEILDNHSKNEEFLKTFEKTYELIISLETEHGKGLKKLLISTQKAMQNFPEIKKVWAEKIPADIDEKLKKVKECVALTRKENRFVHSIGHYMISAQETLGLLEKIKSEKDQIVISYKEKFKKLKDEITDLEAQILEKTRLPIELYAGNDKENLRNFIRDTWKKHRPNDEILTIIIENANWEIEKIFDGPVRYDVPRQNGWVVIKNDEKTALICAAKTYKRISSNGHLYFKVDMETKYIPTKILLSNMVNETGPAK